MADIEIVIKIPEETYKNIQRHDWKNGERWYSEEWKAIHYGTPLPKGHGRLIDADAIKPIKAPIAPLTPEDTVHYEWVYIKSRIDRSPTIIEADKGESEDKE